MRIFRSEMAQGKAGQDTPNDTDPALTGAEQPAAVANPDAPARASIETQSAPPVATI
jgi:hypothetical protein